MKPPFPKPQIAAGQNRLQTPVTIRGEGESAKGVNFSVSWKGWTNGGGERGSTVAQFSRLAEGMPAAAQHTFTGSASLPGLRAQAPAMPTTTAGSVFTANSGQSLLAPVGAAIERLVLHGQDHLTVKVRFETGGSVSIKVAMHGGEISTRIHTDVPGLENGLRASWGQLANEWESRGWKLSNPTFSTGNPADHGDHGARGQAGDERHAEGGAPGSQERAFGGRWTRATRRGHSATSGSVGTQSVVRTAVIDAGGLKTWA